MPSHLEDPEFHAKRADALMAQNQVQAAIDAWQTALQLDPLQPFRLYRNLGNALASLQNYPAALIVYRDAAQLYPQEPDAFANLGRMQQQQRNWQASIASYRRALRLQHAQPATLYRLQGDACRELQQFDEAIAAYQMAVQLQPKQPPGLYKNIGDILLAQQKFALALVAYEQALVLKPNWAAVQQKQMELWFQRATLRLSTPEISPEMTAAAITAVMADLKNINQFSSPGGLPWFQSQEQPWANCSFHLAAAFESLKPPHSTYPKITVVTPSFNQGDYIEQTILSVLHQDYPYLEYIVVDGGSTDQTHDILKRYSDRISHVIIEPDRGQSDALNKGFRLATGELMTWLNSDDMLAPGALYAVALHHLQDPGDILAGLCIVHEDQQIIKVRKPDIQPQEFTVPKIANIAQQWGSAYLFKQPEAIFTRDIWERAGGYLDESLHYVMDYDLWIRMAQAGAQVRILNWTIALFRQHSQQKTMQTGACLMEKLAVRDRYHTFSPDQQRQTHIRQSSCCDNPLSHALLIHPTESIVPPQPPLSSSEYSWQIISRTALKQINLDDIHFIVLIIDQPADDLACIAEIRQRTAAPIAAWFWHSRHYAHNIQVAGSVEFAIPSFSYIANILQNDHSILTPPIPIGFAAAVRVAASPQTVFTSTLSRPDALQVYLSPGSRKRYQPLLEQLEQTKTLGINYQICEVKAGQGLPHQGLPDQERFGIALCLPTENEIPHSLLNALFAGQIAIVPSDIFDLDTLIPPTLQSSLPILKLPEASQLPTVYAEALRRFEEGGLEGMRQRHQFVADRHLLHHRLDQILTVCRQPSL